MCGGTLRTALQDHGRLAHAQKVLPRRHGLGVLHQDCPCLDQGRCPQDLERLLGLGFQKDLVVPATPAALGCVGGLRDVA